jgi:hypothetical protein
MNEKHPDPGPGQEEARPGPGGEPELLRIERRSASAAALDALATVKDGALGATGGLIVGGVVAKGKQVLSSKGEQKPKDE